MKRYNEISAHYTGESCMVEELDGEWVRWESWMENEWIAVEKELPPLDDLIWVWNGRNRCMRKFPYYMYGVDCNFKKSLDNLRITHWHRQIIPEPPKTTTIKKEDEHNER